MADNVAMIRDLYEAFAKGDAKAVLAAFDPKIEWREAEHFPYSTGTPFIGPQAVADNVFARIPTDFDGFRIEVGRVTGAGDTVLVEGRYRGTAKATGKPLNVQMAHVWDVRGGKVAKFQEYVDTWQVAQVTGLTPKS